MIKLVCVNGAPRAGKDTFIEKCLNKLGNKGRAISSVDFVKRIATYCGWNGEKDQKNRKFLSDLKDLLTEWGNIPFKEIEKAMNNWETWNERHKITNDCVLFVCVREPDEIQKLKDKFDATCIFVTRGEAENSPTSNHADEFVYDFVYDLIIDNNGDLTQLENSAETFLNELGFEFS